MSNAGRKIIYIINGLSPGGAEMGLEMLIDYGLFKNVDLEIICLSRCESDLEKRIERKVPGCITYLSDKPVSNNYLLQYTINFIKIVREKKPEIIISSLSQSVLVARLAKFFSKFKLITFEHNTEFQNKKVWYLMKYTDFITDIFWCDSNATEKALIARNKGVNEKLLPLFYMPEKNYKKSDYRIGSSIKLMAVGRLAPQKNYAELIEVIKLLHSRGMNITLSIFGDGEQRTFLEQKVNELELCEIIKLEGFVQDWIKYAIHYDAYILMSDFEGLSIATLEAMSVGLPCIVKPVGELKNYIINNSTGLIVNSINQASDAIERLKNEKALATHLGARAVEYVKENHSESIFRHHFLEAQKDLELIPL
ncbi:hypothetical protein ED28_14795 [[Pantoea] beijingensis]|uniref:Glycosyl transferase family 1 domain-containing protein n=1 Tax=[Pantoea] beijingensis TaxID=1324864 RepID=A0A443IBA6_9GAMM|nr:glycosyltransferase [[Pantoea] beijingensis]RWR01186.1 hypothetical protein ED28_14795 [[Pantoea] beijingensis]